ncbi:hypothetical protein QCE62_30600 [Caballeronia sp. LZ033]|nr:hypothetical protein [Caballeronia sp. LZ033]MDR5817970.1 hypothetical protein [Caballeronia sp. LZ033]
MTSVDSFRLSGSMTSAVPQPRNPSAQQSSAQEIVLGMSEPIWKRQPRA